MTQRDREPTGGAEKGTEETNHAESGREPAIFYTMRSLLAACR